jgi:hypothetical protein
MGRRRRDVSAARCTCRRGARAPHRRRPLAARRRRLGTNDAKRKAAGAGVDNWAGDAAFISAYLEMLSVAAGAPGGGSPDLLVCTPPPVMRDGAYGVSAAVVNRQLPDLVRRVASEAGAGLVDVFVALGGEAVDSVPPAGMTLTYAREHPDGPGPYFCDETWNDQLHPCDRGFRAIADSVCAAVRALGRSGSVGGHAPAANGNVCVVA